MDEHQTAGISSAESDVEKFFTPQQPPTDPNPVRSLARRIARYIYRTQPAMVDFVLDRWTAMRIAQIKRSKAYRERPRLRILAVGVQSPRRPGTLDAIFATMKSSHHDIVFDQKGVEDKGKLGNTNVILERHDLSTFDWVWMVDDDVALPPDFTDIFMALAETAQLKIAAPAHRFVSHSTFHVTVRRPNSLMRETSFVEVGPIVAFRRETFAEVFPLPDLRYGWGLDFTWPMIARRRGWRIGIVDAVPLQHLNPIAATYDTSKAMDESRAYLNGREVIPHHECWQTLQKWNGYPIGA